MSDKRAHQSKRGKRTLLGVDGPTDELLSPVLSFRTAIRRLERDMRLSVFDKPSDMFDTARRMVFGLVNTREVDRFGRFRFNLKAFRSNPDVSDRTRSDHSILYFVRNKMSTQNELYGLLERLDALGFRVRIVHRKLQHADISTGYDAKDLKSVE